MRDTRRVWLAAGLLLVLGCESEPTLTGAVRVDGKLLSKGSIALAPIDGTPGPGGGGGIDKDGKYEIRRGLQPGKYRVEIRSSITLSRQVRNPTIPSELVDEEVSMIPEEYNSKSNLVREIKQGANVLDFNLKSPAPRN